MAAVRQTSINFNIIVVGRWQNSWSYMLYVHFPPHLHVYHRTRPTLLNTKALDFYGQEHLDDGATAQYHH